MTYYLAAVWHLFTYKSISISEELVYCHTIQRTLQGGKCMWKTNRQSLRSNFYVLLVSSFIFQILILGMASIIIDQTKETRECVGKSEWRKEDIWKHKWDMLASSQSSSDFPLSSACISPPSLTLFKVTFWTFSFAECLYYFPREQSRVWDARSRFLFSLYMARRARSFCKQIIQL